MTESEKNEIRAKLQSLRKDIISKTPTLELKSSEPRRPVSPLGEHHQALYDAAQAEAELQKDVAVNSLLTADQKDNLSQINMALSNLENGTYGLCKDCPEEISHKRLMAIPFATQCLSCKEKEEGRSKHRQESSFFFQP